MQDYSSDGEPAQAEGAFIRGLIDEAEAETAMPRIWAVHQTLADEIWTVRY